jgi:hypothetical protein
MTRPTWRANVGNLVNAVSDLNVPGHPTAGCEGTAGHHTIFARYVEQLTEAVETANAWWEGLIDVEQDERTGDRNEAIQNVQERHPGGRVAHRFVIAAVRQVWLACDQLNKRLPPGERVRPEELALSWLAERGYPELAEFISQLAYWPVGLDAQWNWV